MAWWEWLLDAALILLVIILIYGVGLMLRRRLISRHGGTFELSHRVRGNHPGRGWLLGLGRYSGDRLEWFRVFSLSPKPKRVWVRGEIAFVGSRHPEGLEQMSLYPDQVIVECRTRTAKVEMAMSPASLIGFQSWLESRNPGADWSRRHL